MATGTIRGEIVLLIGPCTQQHSVSDDDIRAALADADANLPPSARSKAVAKHLDVPRSRVYALLLERDKDSRQGG